jgi:hypothetical protein
VVTDIDRQKKHTVVPFYLEQTPSSAEITRILTYITPTTTTPTTFRQNPNIMPRNYSISIADNSTSPSKIPLPHHNPFNPSNLITYTITYPDAHQIPKLSLYRNNTNIHTPISPLPPLLLNSQHAPQTHHQARGNPEHHRLGHPAHVAAAAHHNAALRQAGAASEADEEAVFVWLLEVKWNQRLMLLLFACFAVTIIDGWNGHGWWCFWDSIMLSKTRNLWNGS